ncbi:hypothetical protein BGZ98_003026 [Dissophora globulifera]|nr:hypothetical protein BGZ98_003026 [Dissophora globulifera]
MGFTFDIKLDTAQPFVVDLDLKPRRTQVLSGAIVFQLPQPEQFKVATVAIHGQGKFGVALNTDTKPTVVHERLIESTVDLIAANDTEGHGTVGFPEAGTQYLPFRIDIPHSDNLPPTFVNKLDTHYIDWKYEIHAIVQRDSIFSKSTVVKHDLIFRRPIAPTNDTTVMLTASTDMPGQFRSKLTTPSRISLGQEKLSASVEMKARHKSYMVKEIDCTIVQTEDIQYHTRLAHPNIDKADTPGVPCKINASRVVSAVKKIANDDNDMDFGRHKPITLDIHLDHNQMIPTERGLGWLEISHVLRFTVHFMNTSLTPIVTEIPLFVGHEDSLCIEEALEAESVPVSSTKKQGLVAEMSRLVDTLRISGAEKHTLLQTSEREPNVVA